MEYFQVYGLFLLICGLMIINDMKSFSHFLESRMFWPPYFITFNGFMMALLALFGFRATYKKNYKLLVTVRKFNSYLIRSKLDFFSSQFGFAILGTPTHSYLTGNSNLWICMWKIASNTVSSITRSLINFEYTFMCMCRYLSLLIFLISTT